VTVSKVSSGSGPAKAAPSDNVATWLALGDRAGAAIVDWPSGEERVWSYTQLAEATTFWAGALAAKMTPQQRVGIISRNRFEALAAHTGAWLAGVVAVPINHRLDERSVQQILADADVSCALVEEQCRALVGPGLPTLALDEWEPYPASAGGPPPLAELATMLYTSGSTGPPKGVPLSHVGLSWMISATTRHAAPKRRPVVLVAAPLAHMNGFVSALNTFALGGTLILAPSFDATSYLQAVERHSCTWLTSVPTMLQLVTAHPALARTETSSVERVRMGSAPVTRDLFDRVAAAFPSAEIVIGYGTTEIGAAVFGPHPGGIARPPLSLGYPLPDVNVRLVDEGVATRDRGVLEVWTPGLPAHYWNRPDADAANYTSDGWFHTKDICRRDRNGFFFFVERADAMFVCGGENVHPAQVEELLRAHQAVAEACVVPFPDEVKGAKPMAFVVLRPGCSADEDELRQFALREGPAFSHPRRIRFVDELPLAATGKVDRATLERLARDSANDPQPPTETE
jgi:acyl-CoA synthetase (AMP-forming)/AMP-acid ligase II